MIFCVEDDGNIRELVVYTLESTGFQARGFEDGSSFLEALALETPELVLLDIMLPGEDGMELLKKLKASSKTRDIPVIMVSVIYLGVAFKLIMLLVDVTYFTIDPRLSARFK